MITIQKFMSTSINGNLQRKKGTSGIIISPWARAVKATSGAVATNGIHRTNHRNGGSTSRYPIDRIVIMLLLLLAWGWIMMFCGMLFYHGYHYRFFTRGVGTGDTTAIVSTKSLPLLPIQEETSKHQAESRKVVVLESKPTDDKEIQSSARELHTSPLLIFTCQRANYLQETLSDVLKYIPSDCSIGCPIVVSQDGHNTDVAQVIKDFQKKFLQEKGLPLIHIEHKRGAIRVGSKAIKPYEALAVHYGWALQQVFDGHAIETGTFLSTKISKNRQLPQRVIILEEDLHIAPDFFEYFRAMAPLLDSDNSLLAVSAFNDNGFVDAVKDPTRVLRADFFPGLGWMMTRALWTTELQSKWPSGYWDDWLREPQQRQNRKTIRPEISRTYHFGTSGGASDNQYGAELSRILLNDVNVSWTIPPKPDDIKLHWSNYLQNEEVYDEQYWRLIEAARLVANVEEAYEQAKDTDVRLEYNSMYDFQGIVRQLQPPLMDNEKAGIFRSAYKGVVETRPHGGDHFLFLTPPMVELRKAFANILGDSNNVEQR
jgi:alpha-1,3-mannosyl-glycoprotein beta-1,2-N-acetylglucosaminyltransferase